MDEERGSYVAEEMPGGLDVELARLRDQALLWWPKEARTLGWYDLKDGLSVLELGGGPGFITEQLLTMLPNSKITVIERDPTLIEKARRYLESKHAGRFEIVEASVMNMPLPDRSYDFAFARFLFQHLPDPVGAAREVLRVLKPGGRFVINDPDEKLHLWDPPAEPEVEAISERFIQQHSSQGGSRYRARRLPRILKEAGFVNLDIEAVLLHSDIRGIDIVFPKSNPEFLQQDVESGMITEEEKDILIASAEKFYASDPLVQLIVLMAYGEKPQ